MTFDYLTNIFFNSLNQLSLWITIVQTECPEKFFNISNLLHNSMIAYCIYNRKQSATSGDKQVYLIPGTLFPMYTFTIIDLTRSDLSEGIDVTCRM